MRLLDKAKMNKQNNQNHMIQSYISLFNFINFRYPSLLKASDADKDIVWLV